MTIKGAGLFSNIKNIILILIFCCFSIPQVSGEIDKELIKSAFKWGNNRFWDDGRAEVAKYDTEIIVQGERKHYETVMITIKEDMNEALHVKASPPYTGKNLLQVFKFNIITPVPTYINDITHNMLTSIYVKRSNPIIPIKATITSQEWFGNVFKLFKNWDKPELILPQPGTHPHKVKALLIFHSYHDNEGDGVYKLGYEEGYFLFEQLFLSLRTIPFKKYYTLETKVLDDLRNNEAKKPYFIETTIAVLNEEKVKDAKKREWVAWKVMFQRYGEQVRYFWFEKNYPNILVKYESFDGSMLKLKSRERKQYW